MCLYCYKCIIEKKINEYETKKRLSHKSLCPPLARTPATHQDDAADVLVESEAYPHADEAIAERDADEVTKAHGDAPLEDDADDHRIDGVACGTKSANGKDVRGAPDFEKPVDDKHPASHLDYFLILGESAEDASARQCHESRACKRYYQGNAVEIVAENVGCLMAALSHEMSHQYVAALCDADAEQIDEHDEVGAIGACCQRLVAYLVDKEGYGNLRQTV